MYLKSIRIKDFRGIEERSIEFNGFIGENAVGKTSLIETKGYHRDNTNNAAKCLFGIEWEKQAGQDFAYFMIFDQKEVEGAYTLDKAKELIKGM